MADSKKHTPEPWEYGVRKDGSIWLSIGDPSKGPHRQGDLCAREEDARLIVAAPKLLEALKSFQSYGCPVCAGDCASANPPVHSCPMQMAYSAIARAEGRS